MGALEKIICLLCWTSDDQILMADVQKGDLQACKIILPDFKFGLSDYLLKKRPKLGIQLPNDGDDKKSFHILMVLFNRTQQLRSSQYNIYSITLFCTNVLISSVLWRCLHQSVEQVLVTRRQVQSVIGDFTRILLDIGFDQYVRRWMGEETATKNTG